MIHRLVIGDWSKDGHNESDFFSFECNAEEKAIKKAYLQAVKKSGIALHDDAKLQKKIKTICSQYEDRHISELTQKILKDIGVDFKNIQLDDGIYCSPEGIACLFFEMVKTQIPDFEYKLVKEPKTINGFWSKDFNYGIGYGCY